MPGPHLSSLKPKECGCVELLNVLAKVENLIPEAFNCKGKD